MNKKILSASAILAAASLSFGFVLWNGEDGIARVDTELDAGTDNSGYWYFYADDADGGASVVNWKADPDPDYGGLEPVLEACGNGICGSYTLDKGTLEYDPFIGVGFNVGGADEDTKKAIPVDASSMKGVCMTFSVTHAATLEIGLGDANDAKIGYANPAYDLGKSATGKTVDVPWSKFAQPTWAKADQTISIDEAIASVASIKFKVQAKTGSAGEFNIMQVGDYQGGCGGVGIGAKAIQSSLKAQLAGRTLSFGKSVAKAEIVNLQGQVVMAASSVKTMDLSKLQAGVYMVRAMGLSQQIMLK